MYFEQYHDLLKRDSLKRSNKETVILRTECFKSTIDIKNDPVLISIRWRIFNSIRLQKKLYDGILSIKTTYPDYNFLHIRLDNDWINYCRKSLASNCDLPNLVIDNKSYLENAFNVERIKKNVPLLIASPIDNLAAQEHPILIQLCKKGNYNCVFASPLIETIVPNFNCSHTNLISNAVYFELMNLCDTFIGNSLSKFSALQMLKRKSDGHIFHQYNSGNIPFENEWFDSTTKMPLKTKLKWVFTTNSNSISIFDSLKAAVRSAFKNTNLDPYCIYDGPPTIISKWLEDNKVTVIYHEFQLKKDIFRLTRTNLESNIKNHSPLFSSHTAIFATFSRIDIPLLGFMDEYILYTDGDIIFTNSFGLKDFPESPKYFACGPESELTVDNYHNCNVGILLYNIREMMNTYNEFVKYIFLNDKGLFFDRGGPLDQGVMNDYYWDKRTFFPVEFNWKPYFDNWSNIKPYIIHFHGPKPKDIESYLKDGTIYREAFEGLLKKCKLKDSSCLPVVKLYNDLVY